MVSLKGMIELIQLYKKKELIEENIKLKKQRLAVIKNLAITEHASIEILNLLKQIREKTLELKAIKQNLPL